MDDRGDDREAALARREIDVGRREAALASRLEAAKAILEAADKRDVDADHRDDASSRLDQDADFAAFVNPVDDDSYGSSNPTRRHAALDRGYAKDDRASAADDRDMLTEHPGANAGELPEV